MATSTIKKYPTENQLVIRTGIDKQITKTFDVGGSCLVLMQRASQNLNVLLSFESLAAGYTVITGSVPSGIVITKNANSTEITIANNGNYTIFVNIL